MRNKLILMVCASLLAAGCEKIGSWGGRGSAILPNVHARSLTKAQTVTTESLDIFKMVALTGDYIDHTISETEKQKPANGIYFTAYVKKSGTGTEADWDTYESPTATSAKKYFWISGNPMAFWSWYPYDLDTDSEGVLSVDSTPVVPPASGSGTLSFSYTLPEHADGDDADNQQDIVFAGNVETREFDDSGNITGHSSTNSSYNRNDNKLDIVFHHALSKIQFGVDLTDGSFNKDLIIKKIEIGGVCNSGECAFTAPSTFSWDDLDGAEVCSQDYDADFSSYGSASQALPSGWPLNSASGMYACSNCFFLLPQSTEGMTITISFESDGTVYPKTVTLPGGTTWKPDHYYTYKIAATEVKDKMDLSVTLCDWAERENYIPII